MDDERSTKILKFKLPAPTGDRFTQGAADTQVGRTVYSGGPAPARAGIITAATVVDDGAAMEMTVEYPGPAMENPVERAKRLLKPHLESPSTPDSLLDFCVLLMLTTGTLTTKEDVHNARNVWVMQQWPERKARLVPYEDLPTAHQEFCEPIARAIRDAAHDWLTGS